MRLKTVTCILSVMFWSALALLTAQQRAAPAPKASLAAQQQPTAAPKASPNAQARRGPTRENQKVRRPQQEPCWKEVGISPGVMEQRKSIEESARAQVRGVCSESSLSEQEKREKIREIRKSAHEQTMALMSPDQRARLQECQRARQHNAGGRLGGAALPGHPHLSDPCAEVR